MSGGQVFALACNQRMKTIALSIAALTAFTVCGADTNSVSWQDKATVPVANPIYFESPLIQSEIHPFYMYHRMDKSFLGVDTDVDVYALQLRYAINDRLAVIATRDGYIEIHPKGAQTLHGWASLAAGLKYAIAQDEEKQYIVTPGFTFEAPTGSQQVFQQSGGGIFNLFISGEKGYDKLHLTGSLGARVPINWHANTASLSYSGQVDYWFCKWFIPFVGINAFTTISEGSHLPFDSEGFDLANFGSIHASGHTLAAAGVGFRSRLHKAVDLGFAYEHDLISSHDIFKDRVTVDLSIRF